MNAKNAGGPQRISGGRLYTVTMYVSQYWPPRAILNFDLGVAQQVFKGVGVKVCR